MNTALKPTMGIKIMIHKHVYSPGTLHTLPRTLVGPRRAKGGFSINVGPGSVDYISLDLENKQRQSLFIYFCILNFGMQFRAVINMKGSGYGRISQ